MFEASLGYRVRSSKAKGLELSGSYAVHSVRSWPPGLPVEGEGLLVTFKSFTYGLLMFNCFFSMPHL